MGQAEGLERGAEGTQSPAEGRESLPKEPRARPKAGKAHFKRDRAGYKGLLGILVPEEMARPKAWKGVPKASRARPKAGNGTTDSKTKTACWWFAWDEARVSESRRRRPSERGNMIRILYGERK